MDRSCNDRIEENWKITRQQVRDILKAKDKVQKLNETVLSWDQNFHRGFEDLAPCDSLCFSWGGPADYIRYYHDGRITYVFQDWFDGAEKDLTGADRDLAQRLKDEVLL